MAKRKRAGLSHIACPDPMDDDYEAKYRAYLHDASSRLETQRRILTPLCRYNRARIFSKRSEIDALHAKKRSAGLAIKRTLDSIDRCIMVHEAPRYHRLCQEMQDRKDFPREVRDMIYGYMFQDSRVGMVEEECDDPEAQESSIKAPREWTVPYSYLLEPAGYFKDFPKIRQELIEAWFHNTSFVIAGAKTINSYPSRFDWAAGLEPLKLVGNVKIVMLSHNDTASQTRYTAQLESLFVLKPCTTITVALWDLIPEESSLPGPLVPPTMAEYAGFVRWLFPVLRRLRMKGYTVIIRLECNITFVVEPEETTVEGWAKNINAAIKERETLMSREDFTDEDE